MVLFYELHDIFTKKLQEEIQNIEKREPASLYEPVVYCLNMGGKRIRPVLMLMAFRMYSSEIGKVLPAAIAIEMFHNFTLLHDDIMDKAILRRNRKTVHIKYSEDAAILSGDAMSILSNEYLLECQIHNLTELVRIFTETSLKVCEGQQYDMDFEKSNDVSVEAYMNMIGLKTAVLFSNSLKMGAVIAGAPLDEAESLFKFGFNLGLAFQLQDDYLDTFGNKEVFGKNIGGDIASNKKTFLLLKALSLAKGDELRQLNYWLDVKEFDRDKKIEDVKSIFIKLGVADLIREKIEYYFSESKSWLVKIDTNPGVRGELLFVANMLMNRNN